MKQDIAEKWASDLEAHPNLQGKGVMFNGTQYCCLGRLCVLLGYRFEVVHSTVEWAEGSIHFKCLGSAAFLPAEVMEASGMKTSDGTFEEYLTDLRKDDMEAACSLAQMNDDGKTFAEIAKIIREKWEEL
jgi:hypothetical protein